MTIEEVKQILNILTSTYTKEYVNLSNIQKDLLIKTWEISFKNISYDIVLDAVIKYINEPKKCAFPPKPGDLKEIIYDNMENEEISDLEAWSMVKRAIRNNQELAKKEFYKLPDIIQKAIGDYSQLVIWGRSDISQESFIQNSFIKSFREAKKIKKYNFIENNELIGTSEKKLIGE